MFCSRSSNNLINKIHERALSLTSEINDIFFNDLLSINNEISVYNKKHTNTFSRSLQEFKWTITTYNVRLVYDKGEHI